MNLAAGEEAASSFRFLLDEGVVGILRLVFVDSPRIRFWGSRNGAMMFARIELTEC